MLTRTIAAVIAAVAMTACTTTHGSQAVHDFGRWQQLQPGVTTKQELHAIFGQPHEVRYAADGGESAWTYYHVVNRTNASTFVPFVGLVTNGSDLDITRAEFVFAADGRFARSTREQDSRYVNSYAGIGDALTPTGQVAAVEREMQTLGLPFDRRAARDAAAWADQAN
ncbi:MAG TPA: hypothetical protein VEA80_06700 [Vitreimonas sp.]|uniref:hypothetical protein n=1 Tax=Vitreimonas sp. TaxID=3069702 RepID=UPI002D26FCC0|nr:hypothetical protein [Vitreimonas sp.]HYD87143.1 hypothetical protein [Vitreimonas sp.]